MSQHLLQEESNLVRSIKLMEAGMNPAAASGEKRTRLCSPQAHKTTHNYEPFLSASRMMQNRKKMVPKRRVASNHATPVIISETTELEVAATGEMVPQKATVLNVQSKFDDTVPVVSVAEVGKIENLSGVQSITPMEAASGVGSTGMCIPQAHQTTHNYEPIVSASMMLGQNKRERAAKKRKVASNNVPSIPSNAPAATISRENAGLLLLICLMIGQGSPNLWNRRERAAKRRKVARNN